MTYDKFCIFLTIITVWNKSISEFNLTALPLPWKDIVLSLPPSNFLRLGTLKNRNRSFLFYFIWGGDVNSVLDPPY